LNDLEGIFEPIYFFGEVDLPCSDGGKGEEEDWGGGGVGVVEEVIM
jgi:hypothetical protein